MVVQIPYRPGTGALHLLIDSTGIKAAGEGEWPTREQGASQPRSWRKAHQAHQAHQVHLGIDADTLEVRAIEGEPANAIGPREPANGELDRRRADAP